MHADEWPSRGSLAALYRALGAREAGGLDPAAARDAPLRRGARPPALARGGGALGPGAGRARARALGGFGRQIARSASYPRGHRSRAIRGLRRLPRPLRGGPAIPEQAKTDARARGRARPAPLDRRGHIQVGGEDAARPRRAGQRGHQGPDRRRAGAARRPVRGRRRAHDQRRRRRSTATTIERAFAFACERHADQRRKSGEDFITHPVEVAKICAGLRLDTETLCAALLHDTVEDTTASLDEVRGAVRRRGRRARRRRHEADRDHVPEPRRAPGRELPQDDGRDGHGRPGHPDQARRPPPQHAHARGAAEAEADREGARDARDLRAARAPARDPRDQVGARGPRLPAPAPAQVRGDQEARRPAARRARGLRHRRGRVPRRRAAQGRDRGADLGPRQALLLDLLEDDQEGPRVQRDLRPDRDAGDRRLGQGLLRRDRDHPLDLEAAAGPLQGLHRDPEAEPLPGAAHDRDRPRGPAAGDPDPHARTCTRRPSTGSPRT